MKAIPLIYIAPGVTQGTHAGGWHLDLASKELPPVKAWVDALPDDVFGADKLGLLISDAWTHPLRVTLEEKVKKSELPQFLTWKLKRYLPWPADQVTVRYLPLGDDDTWLTFSLPTPWLEGIYAALEAKGVACGFMGGAFATLLENQPRLRNHTNLCFFDDYYVLADLDSAGNYQHFSTRRLPFADSEGHQLDIETLHTQDLAVPLAKLERPLQVFNLAPGLEGSVQALGARIRQTGASVDAVRLEGNPLQRLEASLFSEGAFV